MSNQKTLHANDSNVKGLTIIEVRTRDMIVNDTITQQSSNDVDIRNSRQPFSLYIKFQEYTHLKMFIVHTDPNVIHSSSCT